jgi:tRNA (mo5U34)-methyltransferase
MHGTNEEGWQHVAARQSNVVSHVLEGKSRAELLDLAKTYFWWHAIELDGFLTSGTRSTLIGRAFDQIDFKGKKVLDVGCWDGLWSFEAEKRGATEVYSIDYVSARGWSEQPTYQLAHRVLDSRARYYPNMSVYDIKRLGVVDFDIVIYSGIYYHLLDPLRAFAALRDVMAEGGLMLIEGPVLDDSDRVFANFYCRHWLVDDATNWWVPTIPCLREWLDCTFFDIVSEISSIKDPAQPQGATASSSLSIAMRKLRRVIEPGGVPAAMRKLRTLAGFGRARATTVDPEIQDRHVVVARAASVAERLAHQVNGTELAPLLAAPGVTPEAIAGFCEAAASFHRARPWEGIRHDVTIKVDCASVGAQPAFVIVMGNGSVQRGVAIYFDRAWVTITRQGSLPGDRIAWVPFLAVFYRGGGRVARRGSPHSKRSGVDRAQRGISLRCVQ